MRTKKTAMLHNTSLIKTTQTVTDLYNHFNKKHIRFLKTVEINIHLIRRNAYKL